MPELPEVETTRRGICPHIKGQHITDLVVRNKQLRWPIPASLKNKLKNQKLEDVKRRGKYLLFITANGTAILHLGMSGSLRIVDAKTTPEKHDHVDIVFDNGKVLRFRDPRRFGCLLWSKADAEQHDLLKHLGPEPLDAAFNAEYLFQRSRGHRVNIKNFIMNSQVVTGVGNIYASEALFLAGIHPKRRADRISIARYEKLVDAIKQVLEKAIQQGGTTLKDFVREDGQPGYFKQLLNVYDRAGDDCLVCGQPVKQITLNQRSTYYCSQCQR